MEKSRTIYLAHGYGDRTHFQALYEYAFAYHYQVSEQIILSNKALLGRMFKCIMKADFCEAIGYLIMKIKFYFLRDEILVVSLAPYDYALIKYKKIIRRNRSYFHSSHPTWDGSDFPRGKLIYKRQFENILRTCFNGCFCVSTKTEMGIRQFINNCTVVYHAIDTGKYRHNVSKSVVQDKDIPKRKYVYVGQLIQRKNINLMLQWMKKNPTENVSMTFIGSGNLEENVKKAAIDDQRIVYKGFYSKEQLQQELCEYDFLILPSSFEPLGIVLLEAFASGVPCIVSNVSGPSDIIEDNKTGYMFDINEGFKGFEMAMKRSLGTSEDMLQIMRENALSKSVEFDSRNIIKKWMEMFEA